MRTDVELCATDDRLCQPCFWKNEEQLELVTASGRRKYTRSCQRGATGRTTGTASRRDDEAADQSTSTEVQIDQTTATDSAACQEDMAASLSPLIKHQPATG